MSCRGDIQRGRGDEEMKKIDSIFLEIIELFIALVGILGVGLYGIMVIRAYENIMRYQSFIFILFAAIVCLILSVRLVLRIWQEHQFIRVCMGAVSLVAAGVSILIVIYLLYMGLLCLIQEGRFPDGIFLLFPLALVVGGVCGLSGWYEIKSKSNVKLETAITTMSVLLLWGAWLWLGMAFIV